MSEQDLQDAAPVIERLGKAMDRLSRAGWPELHAATAGYVRERRGKVKGTRLPFGPARDLMNLMEELERLADLLDPPKTVAEVAKELGHGYGSGPPPHKRKALTP